MLIPPELSFTQSSLQDFTDCKRRFQLRYLDRLSWPALETEPALIHERFMQLGARFHQLAQQHQLGLPVERLTRLITDPDLARWWDNYLAHAPTDLPAKRLPEATLTAPLAGVRLLAKYDLLAVEPGRAVIIDWKTSHPHSKHPKRDPMLNRLQTRVYRYLLVEAGAHWNGGTPFQPEQVEMIYWFAEYPTQPYHFPYTTAQYHADRAYFTHLIEDIQTLEPHQFTLTPDEKRCVYCPYRSLCDRGTQAGDLAEWDTDLTEPAEIEFTLEQIAEIEF
ncbi:MAG: PD-(D/E)XK nuclease family protein [Anaerolineales bacterium]